MTVSFDRDERRRGEALSLVSWELDRLGLTSVFKPRLYEAPCGNEYFLQLTHRMAKPLINESFTEFLTDLENGIVDSTVFQEHIAAAADELYRATEQIAKLKEQIKDLERYKQWYLLEKEMLEAAACIEFTKKGSGESEEPDET